MYFMHASNASTNSISRLCSQFSSHRHLQLIAAAGYDNVLVAQTVSEPVTMDVHV